MFLLISFTIFNVDVQVIGACGSPEKFEIVKQKGAKYVIDYNKEDVRARLKEITAGRGVDVVFDTVGGDGFINALKR